MQQRTTILTNIKTRLNGYYGPSGTEDKLFREVRMGPIRPVTMHPTLTIVDGGQERNSPWDDEQQERILRPELWLTLADNWTRLANQQEWTDNVEMLIQKLNNWMIPNCGVLNMLYVRDEPFDVIWTEGETAAIWMVEFECRYFTEAEDREDWV